MIRSFLGSCARIFPRQSWSGDEGRDTLKQGRGASLEGEMARAQKFAGDLERQMAELKLQTQ